MSAWSPAIAIRSSSSRDHGLCRLGPCAGRAGRPRHRDDRGERGSTRLHRQRVVPAVAAQAAEHTTDMSPSALKPTLTVLVAMSALQPIALNLLAPAAPALSRHFGSSYATIQLALTFFLVAVALTQLVMGRSRTASGRRPASMPASRSSSPARCWGRSHRRSRSCCWRASWRGRLRFRLRALARAIIRDTANRDEAASQIATVTMVMVVAPMIAPWLGGQIETAFGWRMILWFMTVSGVDRAASHPVQTARNRALIWGLTARRCSASSGPPDTVRQPRLRAQRDRGLDQLGRLLRLHRCAPISWSRRWGAAATPMAPISS